MIAAYMLRGGDGSLYVGSTRDLEHRMFQHYSSAGSAYTYVGEEIHPALGYLTGWSMLLDYVLNPLICTIWCAKAAN